ncbi:MAG TPA: MoaD/ThiS family protein [Planctomycetaceae bacterium]|nr:MoaD/ThiS family protein [Planctomycetaceae bacterium]
MVTVDWTPHLRQHLFDTSRRRYDGATLRDVLFHAFAEEPRLRGYVLDDQDRLRQHVTVFINGSPVQDRVRLSDVLADGDEVYVFQALSGG